MIAIQGRGLSEWRADNKKNWFLDVEILKNSREKEGKKECEKEKERASERERAREREKGINQLTKYSH